MPPKPKPTTPLRATKHADKRTNIPTEELKDFLPEEAQRPTPIRYPRDPSMETKASIQDSASSIPDRSPG